MVMILEKRNVKYDHWQYYGILIEAQLPTLAGHEQILTEVHCRVGLHYNMTGNNVRIGFAHPINLPGKALSGQILTLLIPLDAPDMVRIEYARQRKAGMRDVYLTMEGWIGYIISWPDTPADRKTYAYEPVFDNFKVVESGQEYIRLPETDWLRFYGDMGKDVASIVVTDRAARELMNLRMKLGVSDDEGLIGKVTEAFATLEAYRSGAKVDQSIVWTLPDDKGIRNKVDEILSRAVKGKEEVLISGFVDSAVEPRLKELLKQGGRIRLMVRKGGVGTEKMDRAVGEVVNRLKKEGAAVEHVEMLHARALISGSECIISSADLKTDSLDKNRELGVYTTDPEIVQRARTFFEKVWADK